ncbi:hypothetical protein Bbelb_293460 [Branchiostoma belcheri]|nr:hypothetical protein Bbelb_293460 [Branchiostoma belcheri]
MQKFLTRLGVAVGGQYTPQHTHRDIPPTAGYPHLRAVCVPDDHSTHGELATPARRPATKPTCQQQQQPYVPCSPSAPQVRRQSSPVGFAAASRHVETPRSTPSVKPWEAATSEAQREIRYRKDETAAYLTSNMLGTAPVPNPAPLRVLQSDCRPVFVVERECDAMADSLEHQADVPFPSLLTVFSHTAAVGRVDTGTGVSTANPDY